MTELPPCRPAFPVRAPHRVVAAPRPLGGAPVVELDDAWPVATAERLRLLASAPGRVRVEATGDPDGLRAALRAALALVPEHPLLPGVAEHLAALRRAAAPTEGPDGDVASRGGRGDVAAHLAPVAGVAALADEVTLRQPADLVVLRRTGPGALAAELLAVAFPSGWVPAERAGAALTELHAPVAHNERLQRAAPALSEALLTKGPFLQYVWGLQRDPGLARDPSAPGWPPPPDPAGRWWLRVERQTTWPLPELGRALFFIRPTLTPLADLDAGQRATLAASLTSMDGEALRYKGLSALERDALCRSLSS